MPKFFRRIKRKLWDEGSLRKYLIYAIGEILLVVIGVLIALQINNWNEDRKERVLEDDYLAKISLNIEDDIIQYNKILEANNQGLNFFEE